MLINKIKSQPIFILFIILLVNACTVTSPVSEIIPETPPKVLIPDSIPHLEIETKPHKDFELFLDIIAIGFEAIKSDSFQKLLSYIPNKYKDNPMVVIKIDELPLGVKLNQLGERDLALENGFYKGLLSSGFSVIEKLDSLNIRNISEFIDTSPPQGFYMHPIDLNAHSIIQDNYNTNLLLEYQIISFQEKKDHLIVYFRLVDIENMKILGSTLVRVGNLDIYKGDYLNLFNKTYDIFKSIELPVAVVNKLKNTALLNLDILNISGEYSTDLSIKSMAIENGIISGLIENLPDYEHNPFLIEKANGFKLKYPEVYSKIVFNTNPLLYEEWDEVIEKTGSTEFIFYRYIKNEGIYIRIVDVELNGKIIYSGVLPFSDHIDIGIFHNHNVVSDNFINSFDFNLIKNKNILIIDGEKHSLQPIEYIESRKKFNQMHLAIEEGFISALVRNSEEYNFSVYEKLKTIYLKQPWMYNDKIFYLNPLYLDEWDQLQDYLDGGNLVNSIELDIILLYNNLVPYEEISSYQSDFKNVALSYRWIDIKLGTVFLVDEITNYKGK